MVLNKDEFPFLREACVETFAEAQTAQKNGADLIELCSHLELDGLTPTLELTQKCFEKLDIPLKVMIRSRTGNFVYNRNDLLLMQKQITDLKGLGITQFVFGALSPGKRIDLEVLEFISNTAENANFTFHKAFDEIKDWEEGIEQIKSLHNFTHILSSGGKKTAMEGSENLKKMIQSCANQLTIIPAGKVTLHNLHALHDELKASHYHGRKIV